MKKFLTIVKREYVQRVRAKMFIVSTILLPVVMSLFAVVPAIILNIEAGPLRVAVIDQTGKMFAPLQSAFANEQSEEAAQQPSPQPGSANQTRRGFSRMGSRSFQLTEVKTEGRSAGEVKAELDHQLLTKQIDGYLVVPPDFLSSAKAEFFNNNPGDMLSREILTSSLTRALREQRLVEAKVSPETRRELFRRVGKSGSEG